jgi:hypothetical protein
MRRPFATTARAVAVLADRRYIRQWSLAHVKAMKHCIEFTHTLGAYDVLMPRDVRIGGCCAAAAKF